MKIGGMLAGGFLLEISMTSLLLGWGVNLLMRHHSFNSRSAEFNWAVLFFCRVSHAVNCCVVSKHIDESRRHKGWKINREKSWLQNGPLRNSGRDRYHV